MWSRVELVSGPQQPVIDTDVVMAALRITANSARDEISRLTGAAVLEIERLTGRRLGQQTWDAYYDQWYVPIRLPLAPVRSVTSVEYLAQTGEWTTVDTATYVVIPGDWGAVWPSGGEWPSDLADQPGRVRVRYVAGHDPVPDPLIQAVVLLVGQWYDGWDERRQRAIDAIVATWTVRW